ncbi:MAG: bifunctional adenosylcobinamide kinase/adenosylcobinamide-phosphate guanylyltransferase [Deltaproteobacteria bacterium]|nr:bifunctional adenosylcobinamide kinase/adenosylcobinamide-phosphate guanylyltransferase [Deltaproteobacteria bacterium]
MEKMTLVTGGARSGKSSYALSLADAAEKNVFIATAEALDNEMQQRIDRHQQERGDRFLTIEAPVNLAQAIRSVEADTQLVIVDCLTVWLGNLLVKDETCRLLETEIESLLEVLKNPPCRMVFVTNEVGMGIVPINEMARDFRDRAGWLNQSVAALAEEVVFIVSGIPMTVKGNIK